MKLIIHYLFFVSILCLVLFSCATKDISKPPVNTSYLSITGEKLSANSATEYIFRQTAVLNMELKEESLIAWKITTTDSLLPDGIVTDNEGWIYHYTAGADTSVPLSSPECQRTIWISGNRQVWDFASVNGRLAHIISRIEVKVKQPGQSERTYTEVFRTDRIISTLMIVPFSYGDTVGTGFHVSLREQTSDIYVEGMYAHHFMYRINIMDLDWNLTQPGTWHSSLDCENIRELYFTGLAPNDSTTFTQLEVYVVTRQGVEEATHKIIIFKVYARYHPKSLIYTKMVSALGQYHYSTGNPDALPPSYYFTNDNVRWNTHLFRDENNYCAVNSPDLTVRLSFGWHGQYGIPLTSGSYLPTNDTFDSLINQCLDEDTNQNYYSYITHFDLQMNYAPFPNQAQFGNSTIVTHSDNTQWRRVPYTGQGAMNVMLTGMPHGTYTVKCSAVDAQNVYDPTPAVMTFELEPYIGAADRNGILIIDDDLNNANFCPDAAVDAIYENLVPTAYGPVVQWNRETITYSDIENRRLSFNLLQHYKLVIYHSDYGTSTSNFPIEADPIALYLSNGGNLILSGGANLKQALENTGINNPYFVNNYLSNTLVNNSYSLTNSMASNPFFVSALSENTTLNDIPLNLTSSYNVIINSRQGLGPVTYFTDGTGLTPLYRFGCKLPGADVYPPTQEVYDNLSTKHVALSKNLPAGGKFLIFGFPLSMMEQVPMAQDLFTIISDILTGTTN